MRDYMDHRGNIAYSGPPFKVPPPVFVRQMPKARVHLSVHPQLVDLGVDAQTQTSFAQTSFPLELVTPQTSDESFGDILTSVHDDENEMIFDDPSMLSQSHSFVAVFTWSQPRRSSKFAGLLCMSQNLSRRSSCYLSLVRKKRFMHLSMCRPSCKILLPETSRQRIS